MLVEFSTANVRSIKDLATLSLVATKLTARDREIDINNTMALDGGLVLLKSAAIYGANASGKSNLIQAMHFMKQWVLNSSKETQSGDEIPVDRHRLSTESRRSPAFFEIVIIVEGVRYRYGFEATPNAITREWLFHVPTSREAKLFERTGQKISIMPGFKEGRDLEARTRGNALFLSVVAQFNGQIASQILEWFRRLTIVSGVEDESLMVVTLKMLEDGRYIDEIRDLVRNLDVGVRDLEIRRTPISTEWLQAAPDEVRRAFQQMIDDLQKHAPEGQAEEVSVITSHAVYSSDGKQHSIEAFDINQHESEGTKKLFALAGALVGTLKEHRTIVIDELDARLHPIMTQAIIRLFQTGDRQRAQLVFTTHDVHLLSKDLFRRDQIWFTEKDRFGATHLYSLAEFKVRNDASYDTDYIKGKYGAVPYPGEVQSLLEGSR